MSESTPSYQHDLNLLFGIVALQIDLIDERQFVEACSLWASRKDATLADVLAQRGWLSAEGRAEVERLVRRKLDRFKEDARQGLVSLVRPTVAHALGQVPDEPIRQSLADLVATTPSDHAPILTSPYDVAQHDRYQLQRLHARGGIGQVWLARDDGLGREIALKELRPDRREGSAYVARFIREAQITGQLEHPGIVPVYELVRREQQHGGPFYVMRFIKGRTLKQATSAFHEKRPDGPRGLEFRALISALVAVCNAVAYAHHRGVIHRDLKGQNVVVGDYGEVILIDWGLARLIGQSEPDLDTPPAVAVDPAGQFTQPGQVVGTPAFMAPEQASGRLDLLDARTDVYGLGAILYEILTGRPPYVGEDQAEVLRLVIQGSPPPPRRHWPQTPAALEAVCLKAMAREPDGRYAGAAELAHELQSWLADEPVAAYPEPLPARAGRWARRHQSAVSSTVVLLLAGVISLGVGMTLLGQEKSRTQNALEQAKNNLTFAEQEGKRATTNAEQATAARDRAEANLRQGRAAVDQLLVRVSEDDTLLANEPRMEQLRRRLLQDALGFYLDFVKHQAGDVAVRRDLILTYRRIARLQQDLGAYGEAEKACVETARLCAEMRQSFPDDPLVERELAGITNSLGNVYRLTGKLERSRDALLEALKSRQALAERHDNQAELVEEVATTLFNLAQVYRELGELPDAEQAGRGAAERFVHLADQPDAPAALHRSAVRSLILLSSLQEDRDDKAGQEKTLLTALSRLQFVLEAHGPTPSTLADLATCRHNLGIVHRKTGRLPSADKHLSAAVTVRRQLVSDFPRVAAYRNDLGGGLRSLALVRMEQDKPAEARKLLEEARVLQQKLCDESGRVPQFHLNLAITLSNLALAHQMEGDDKEAERLLRKAAAIEQELTRLVPGAGDYPSAYALSLHNLGLTCLDRKEYKAADRFFAQAIEGQDRARRANPNHVVYRKRLRAHYQGRGEALAGLKDSAALAALARRWHKELQDDWRDGYLAAALLSRACSLSAEPGPLAAEAVKMLSEARQKGISDSKLLSDNPAFAPLRDREDYRDLLAGMEARKDR